MPAPPIPPDDEFLPMKGAGPSRAVRISREAGVAAAAAAQVAGAVGRVLLTSCAIWGAFDIAARLIG